MNIEKIDSANLNQEKISALADELAAFCKRCFVATYKGLETPSDIVISYASETFTKVNVLTDLKDAETFFLLVRDPKKHLVGYVKAVRKPPPEEVSFRPIHVARFYLASQLQGQGFGKKLLDHLEQEILAQGYTGIWLSVYDHNLPAKAFYEKNGFYQQGEIPWTHQYKGKLYTDMDKIYYKDLNAS
jgi:ribosomal protein S18 acetylase RimI-like enzyme